MMFQYVGLIAVLLSWLSGAYLLTRWRNKDILTISGHAASHPVASLLFSFVVAGLGAVFYIWAMVWLVPHLQLGVLFKVLVSLTLVMQLITGLVPATAGWKGSVHYAAAYGLAISLLPLPLSIIASPVLTDVAKIVCGILMIYMWATFALIVILRKARSRFLLFQCLYFVSFQTLVLIAAYS